MSSDPTIQTILNNVIAMRGELSAAIKVQEVLPQITQDIDDIKSEQKITANDRKWRRSIAATIGAVSGITAATIPEFISKAAAALFNHAP